MKKCKFFFLAMGKTFPVFLGISLITTMSFAKSYHVAKTRKDKDYYKRMIKNVK
jgi:hypothetical protein